MISIDVRVTRHHRDDAAIAREREEAEEAARERERERMEAYTAHVMIREREWEAAQPGSPPRSPKIFNFRNWEDGTKVPEDLDQYGYWHTRATV